MTPDNYIGVAQAIKAGRPVEIKDNTGTWKDALFADRENFTLQSAEYRVKPASDFERWWLNLPLVEGADSEIRYVNGRPAEKEVAEDVWNAAHAGWEPKAVKDDLVPKGTCPSCIDGISLRRESDKLWECTSCGFLYRFIDNFVDQKEDE